MILVGVVGIGLATRDGGPFAGKFRIECDEFLLIFRHVFFSEDGTFRAFRNTDGAVDAFVGVDHEKVRPFAEAVHGADVDAVSALASDTGFADNVGHWKSLLCEWLLCETKIVVLFEGLGAPRENQFCKPYNERMKKEPESFDAASVEAPCDPEVRPAGTTSLVLALDTSRRIVHVDMDAFYASVEQRDRPELRGKPIAVGHAQGRGVVATASYEARKYGVRSAMPSARARELCPELIFVEGRMSHYKAVSKQIHEIFHRYTDIIEPISLDEAFLDVTVNKAGLSLGVEVARAVKRDIRSELGLVASAGVSYNKFLAKVASDWRKPDGLCTIHPDRAIDFIDRLPVEAFWGVGPATAAKFHALGVRTAPELRAMPLADLLRHFGQSGYDFYRFVRGIDDRPVRAFRQRKSVGCERTFERDVRSPKERADILNALVLELVRRLERAEFTGSTLTLKVRHYDFTTRTRAYTSDVPYRSADVQRLGEDAARLLAGFDLPTGGVRLMGLSVSSPVETDADCPTLFD